jgi:hypothetical protein
MLLSPLRQNKSRGRVSVGAAMPAPVEGWDDESPWADMSPLRAIIMDNWFPQPSHVELRRGWADHSDTGETAPVRTLMAYHAPNAANDALFAACDDTIYDVSASLAVASTVTGLSNTDLQYVNFTTSGGSYLYTVNGADLPNMFDGSAWSNPAITGIDESTFINVNVFKSRLYFIPVNSTKFWYLPVDSIAGAATSFELGGVMSMGGAVVAMGTLTLDGGAGPDDHAVFVTSKGQVIVYQGSDPSDANAWALVGVYNIAPPIGYRCTVKIAGDIGILTTSGLLPLSKAMVVDRAALDNVALTGRIQNAMTRSAREYGSNSGWGVCVYPKSNMCLVNVPVDNDRTSHQYVMNTLHGAWARFIGQDAYCWEVFKDRLFFGGMDGIVREADIASSDGGADITADLKTAFSYYGSKGTLKQWKMAQTLIFSDGRVVPGIKLNVDYQDSAPTFIPAAVTPLNAISWDGFSWDEAEWPGDGSLSQKWQAVQAIGQCAAIRMRVIANSDSASPIKLQVNGFHLIYERGGFL